MPAAAVAPPRSRRLTRPPHVAFTATALTLSALYVAAGAPSPILSLLEQRWGFAPWVLTIAFAVYALGLLAALLVTGSLSDYVGRRPVMLGAGAGAGRDGDVRDGPEHRLGDSRPDPAGRGHRRCHQRIHRGCRGAGSLTTSANRHRRRCGRPSRRTRARRLARRLGHSNHQPCQ